MDPDVAFHEDELYKSANEGKTSKKAKNLSCDINYRLKPCDSDIIDVWGYRSEEFYTYKVMFLLTEVLRLSSISRIHVRVRSLIDYGSSFVKLIQDPVPLKISSVDLITVEGRDQLEVEHCGIWASEGSCDVQVVIEDILRHHHPLDT